MSAREHEFKGTAVQNLDSRNLFLIEGHLQVACLVKQRKSNKAIMFHHNISEVLLRTHNCETVFPFSILR